MTDLASSIVLGEARQTPVDASVPPRRRFFVVMGIVLLLPVLIGFAPTLFLRPWLGTGDYLGGASPVVVNADGTELTIYPGGPFLPHLLLHGLALAAWFSLFLVQASLVATGRIAVHRTLGVVGIAVAIAVVVSSVVTMARSVDRLSSIGAPPEAVQAIVVGDTGALTLFVGFVAVAVLWRTRPAVHKRLLLLATIPLTGPAFSNARPLGAALEDLVPGLPATPIFFLSCCLALVTRDLIVDRRVHPATGWGIAVFLAVVAIVIASIGTPAAATYVAFMRSLA